MEITVVLSRPATGNEIRAAFVRIASHQAVVSVFSGEDGRRRLSLTCVRPDGDGYYPKLRLIAGDPKADLLEGGTKYRTLVIRYEADDETRADAGSAQLHVMMMAKFLIERLR